MSGLSYKRYSEGSAPFRSMIRELNMEVWTHSTDKKKFDQFGWRSGTNESNYSIETLIGNWNEERYDIQNMKKDKHKLSQYSHNFETTYHSDHGSPPTEVPANVKYLPKRAWIYPGHQPELDLQNTKEEYNSYATVSRISYIDHRVRDFLRETNKHGQTTPPKTD